MSIIAIAGFPLAGKTTLAKELAEESGHEAISTDHLLAIELSWSDISQLTADWFDSLDEVIIEGVAVPRALRKWLSTHDEGKPCDTVYWLAKPKALMTDDQLAMGRGCLTVFKQISAELVARGVEVKLV